ncbi:hypothetical protein HZH66_001080 [Vespula vulgaris]|uniref:Uncharacterized protein n=1 Tax=Vespula vulgaris TaxID=7454 RepID=A0A834KVT0_VESVU|nr:hypothetical protein HZH66_001080 [Vespula vulgaris]
MDRRMCIYDKVPSNKLISQLAAFFGKESPLVAAFGISAFELGVAPDVISLFSRKYPIVVEGDDTIGGDCDDDGGSDGGSGDGGGGGGGGGGDGGGGGGGGGGGVGQESRVSLSRVNIISRKLPRIQCIYRRACFVKTDWL